ncbi:MAG: chemotaxis protein CheW [Gammaproteobacteria bacterium]
MTDIDPFDTLWVLQSEYAKWIADHAEIQSNLYSWNGIIVISADEEWAIALSDINEIVMTPKLTPVPNVKPWLKGIFNLRGALLAVTDLAELLTGKTTSIRHHSRVLARRYEDEWVGILVDGIVSSIIVPKTELKIVDKNTIQAGFRPFVEEMITVREKRVPILSLAKLVDDASFRRVSSIETGLIG